MKKRLSLMAVAVLSCVGWSAAAEPLDGTLHLGPAGDEAGRDKPVTCPNCVAGVRG